ncbi:MAG: tRNA lysidine(34) synthetase TilS [Geobacteraceae bacterium]
MLKTLSKTIREHSLFCEGDTLVVAVSGGADSVALLDLLAMLVESRLRLVVAHLNHCLRGAESDGDASFVRELALHYGLPVEIGTVDVRELSRRMRLSLEAAGRAARYAFLDEVALRHGAAAVVLAHHADDQAETVLLRLIRGAAGAGLCGMTAKSANGRYIRPLLNCKRAEIERYLTGRRIAWRVDSSNTDLNFLRNRVRHELLPVLASYNPAISERLTVTAAALAEDEALLDGITDEAFIRHSIHDKGEVVLCLDGVRKEAKGLRMRLYRRAIANIQGGLERIAYRHLEDIDRLVLAGRPQAALNLPDGMRVARRYDKLLFAANNGEELPVSYEFLVEGPGVYPLPKGGQLIVKLAESPLGWLNVPITRAYIDLDAAPFPWFVRPFRAGDRFVPFGLTGRKKVKEMFIDLKLPSHIRQRIPILFCGERLLWVGGVRRAEDGRLTSSTRSVAMVEILYLQCPPGFSGLEGEGVSD